MNSVSVEYAANLVLIGLKDPKANNQIIEIGGPEVLSMKLVVGIKGRVTWKPTKLNHIPVPMMQMITLLIRLVNPARKLNVGKSVFILLLSF